MRNAHWIGSGKAFGFSGEGRSPRRGQAIHHAESRLGSGLVM
jgi:hypothetical protein